ncbi:MAG TPA: PqqD family protein [Gemmatimonadaceae bacterium]|nr:PqqD family protein [Gemmatimonadaceae bacterium]
MSVICGDRSVDVVETLDALGRITHIIPSTSPLTPHPSSLARLPFKVSASALVATLDDGSVVLDLRTKRYYSLNETAALVWSMLEGDHSIEAILRRLCETYEVSGEEARRSLDALLAELEAEELVHRVEE